MGADGWVIFYDRKRLLKALNRLYPPEKCLSGNPDALFWDRILDEYSYNESVVVRYWASSANEEDMYWHDWLTWIPGDYFGSNPMKFGLDEFNRYYDALKHAEIKRVMVWT